MIVSCKSCARKNRLPASRLGDVAKCAACKSPLLPLSAPIAIASTEDFDELVRNAVTPVLVDFWAAWCGPCRMVGPELEKVAASRAGKVVVAKVDTEALGELANRFTIRSIPTMILFRQGKESKRLSGAMPATSITAQFDL
jgi:thioredoxin 2